MIDENKCKYKVQLGGWYTTGSDSQKYTSKLLISLSFFLIEFQVLEN